jgi:hypothetical protein
MNVREHHNRPGVQPLRAKIDGDADGIWRPRTEGVGASVLGDSTNDWCASACFEVQRVLRGSARAWRFGAGEQLPEPRPPVRPGAETIGAEITRCGLPACQHGELRRSDYLDELPCEVSVREERDEGPP